MPRYHFNIFDGVTVLDREGMQLPGIEVARREGIRLAAEMLKRGSARDKPVEDLRVEVTDEWGMILYRIDIMLTRSAALTAQKPGPLPPP